jgi:hypothetical protein
MLLTTVRYDQQKLRGAKVVNKLALTCEVRARLKRAFWFPVRSFHQPDVIASAYDIPTSKERLRSNGESQFMGIPYASQTAATVT